MTRPTECGAIAIGLICFALDQSACRSAADANIAEGRALYQQNGCVNCHGAGGRGDGPLGTTLVPRPRDFRDAAAFKNGTEPSSIAATIDAGIGAGGSRMPRFDHLTERERRSLALFVVSLRDPSQDGAVPAAVVARDAWIREPLAAQAEAALFVVLENRSSETRAVVAAASDAADAVELHEMKMTGSMMSMSRAASVALKPRSATAFASGTFHIMLFGLKHRPVPGESVTITLTLDNGAVVPVKAEVRKQEMVN